MAKEIVIFPGGFHPIHPGHVSVYNALKKSFPAAAVYLASSDSTKERPFPFDDKKVLATAAGIPTDKFIEVVTPYKATEITKNYDPSKDLLIFGLSAKDASRLSYTKKDGTAGYFQKYLPDTVMDPFEKHAYVYIAPTVTFKLQGQAVSSASIIRKMYGEADDTGKYEILKELYPKGDPKKIKTIFDRALTTSESFMPQRYKAGQAWGMGRVYMTFGGGSLTSGKACSIPISDHLLHCITRLCSFTVFWRSLSPLPATQWEAVQVVSDVAVLQA